jgi:hypothetical protein
VVFDRKYPRPCKTDPGKKRIIISSGLRAAGRGSRYLPP